ncbi:MAG: hypothetical protein O2955_19080 [Planctomycetota bacterium]|nr:hypothetical protein [Planctomycetota bacterium]MDA1214620.1 hypothetical protein [Planctomycetota bacterium]
MIYKLHEAKHHEHVIAAIEAAILNDQSQPWMYEALALSMEISGRPSEEIERVLLSQIDFTAADIPSMLYSAAYLNRLGAKRQAMKMYQQSAQLNPSLSEPYILGLKLAHETKDWESVEWAATGIMRTAWVQSNFKTLMQEAEDVSALAVRELEKANDIDRAKSLKSAMLLAKQRDLVVNLTWNGKGDIDLLVEEPHGTICSFDHTPTSGGGVLAHDGYGPVQSNCHEDYICMYAWPGTYRIRVRYFSGEIVGKRAVLTVVLNQGTEREQTKKYTVDLSNSDQIYRIEVPDGRRQESTELAEPVDNRQGNHHGGRSSIQLVGHDRDSREAKRRFQESRLQLAPLNAFNVGYQPIISTLAEGAAMNAMAVISGDRRYVRISVSPNFSSVTDIFTFSFLNTGNTNTGGQNGQ